ncbi:hypothetical protein [Streptomyces sp. 1222.5]|uniref:hypothetical protein n=1 Tax=Streptomyces sp. 1222.5 TaxID=1881026 RepID=UPI003D722E6C
MIRPTLTADGLAVRLPIADRAEQLLDALAVAYTADPDTVGHLLTHHGANVVRLDHAVVSEDMPEHERAIRAAEADGSREALVAEAPLQPRRPARPRRCAHPRPPDHPPRRIRRPPRRSHYPPPRRAHPQHGFARQG